jgi:multimeric flavodoxin WrbA
METMKVLAINGSARKGGNTRILLDTVCGALTEDGVDTEVVELSGLEIHGCRACEKCAPHEDCCAFDDDDLNPIIEKMHAADGLLLGSPVYFSDVTAEMKALIDRSGRVSRTRGNLLRRKVGAAVVAVRRAGAMHTFDTLNHFFGIMGMFTVGSSYWNIGIGWGVGEVDSDSEGLKTMTELGHNMAWLLQKLHA